MHRINNFLPGIIDVPSGATWEDLVLPAQIIQRLHEYALWVTHRGMVEQEWGARVSGGPIALFSGPPGTGKTFAAEVLANTLALPLFRVELGSLVSKYIGETEKNLGTLFDAVTKEPMLLLFDGADSLFARRGEVKDAHDRYAYLELSYLLRRLERHKGPSILTSNLRQDIDPVVVRRVQMVIDFPFPDEAARSELWRLHIPAGAPIDEDVETDQLAMESELTGGQIRNAALHAAFLAAGESSTITLNHFASAVQTELAKTGGEKSRKL